MKTRKPQNPSSSRLEQIAAGLLLLVWEYAVESLPGYHEVHLSPEYPNQNSGDQIKDYSVEGAGVGTSELSSGLSQSKKPATVMATPGAATHTATTEYKAGRQTSFPDNGWLRLKVESVPCSQRLEIGPPLSSSTFFKKSRQTKTAWDPITAY